MECSMNDNSYKKSHIQRHTNTDLYKIFIFFYTKYLYNKRSHTLPITVNVKFHYKKLKTRQKV